MTVQGVKARMKEIEVQKISADIDDQEELGLYRQLAREVIFGTHEAMESFYDLAFDKPAEAVRLMLNQTQATAA